MARPEVGDGAAGDARTEQRGAGTGRILGGGGLSSERRRLSVSRSAERMKGIDLLSWEEEAISLLS